MLHYFVHISGYFCCILWRFSCDAVYKKLTEKFPSNFVIWCCVYFSRSASSRCIMCISASYSILRDVMSTCSHSSVLYLSYCRTLHFVLTVLMCMLSICVGRMSVVIDECKTKL